VAGKGERIGWLDGLVLGTREATVVIDPQSLDKVPDHARVLVSHAHADHTYGFRHKGMKQSTPETREIHNALTSFGIGKFEQVKLGDRVVVEDIEVEALNAGHMLGSAQFLAHTPFSTVLYTGDINCIDTLTTKAAEPKECDILVIEATYGSPMYRFPRREQVYSEMVEWALYTINQGILPIFHVYAAGKAQEVVKLFNLYTKIPVVVSPRLDGVNGAYARSGHPLEWKVSTSHEGRELLEKGQCVYLTTPNQNGGTLELANRRIARAYATGWAMSYWRGDAGFPLSSHADFDQLVSYIKECNPKQVFVFTGFVDGIRRALSSALGRETKLVPSFLQRTITEQY
jgi:putative mRNA 3-end processing factor